MSAPDGCATCEHATARFNNGNGATTCALLGHWIVSYGTKAPTERPAKCPKPTAHTVATVRVMGLHLDDLGPPPPGCAYLVLIVEGEALEVARRSTVDWRIGLVELPEDPK